MFFNPLAIIDNFALFLGILAIVLIVKPITAFLIAYFMRYPVPVALSIGLALAQVGEFSFILAEEANKLNIFPRTKLCD